MLRKQRTHPEHVLFIDASEHYEKVSTQYKLRPEDISKIIDIYKKYVRGDWDRDYTGELEEKYSYISNRAEIAENDYNLNIPRYVDTFEEEEPVVLEAVAKELKALDKDMQKTDETISNYCKELGIEAPF